MPGRALVLDANILVRAVFGNRVRQIIETYAGSVSFFIPEAAYREAEEHVAMLVLQRGGDEQKALKFLSALAAAAELITAEVYGEFDGGPRATSEKRSRRLADPRIRPGAGMPDLDGRHRLLRLRRRNVDIRSRPDVLSRIVLTALDFLRTSLAEPLKTFLKVLPGPLSLSWLSRFRSGPCHQS
jgi:PIN domain